MVRTSRNGAPSAASAASMDALDNIDLDDMFADDGDALFDGLDIDLDMDDITGSSEMIRTTTNSATTTTHRANRPLMGPATVRPPPPPSAAADEDESGRGGSSTTTSSRTRRKTKRKAKTPVFFEDTDDDADTDHPPSPVTTKKRKTNAAATAATTKRKSKHMLDTSTSTTASTKPSSMAVAANAIGNAATLKKSKLTISASASSMMPPPPHTQHLSSRGQSTPGSYVVAAAGQFGGRQKRGGSSFALPKASNNSNANSAATGMVGGVNKNKLPFARTTSDTTGLHKSSHRLTPNNAANHNNNNSAAESSSLHQRYTTNASASSATTQPSRTGVPPNQTFCGLGPSHTLFYPFMPTLPPDLALKSRKVYPTIDRIHALFATQPQPTNAASSLPVQSTEPIFHLLQEAFKDEKTIALLAAAASSTQSNTNTAASLAFHRAEMVGQAIGGIRRTVGMLDQSKIVADWIAVCVLLQRQHDFLQQSDENMERWCRGNFSDEDFASVFLPSSKTRIGPDGKLYRSILGDFTTRDLKVMVQYHGFKASRADLVLRATLPDSYMLDISSTDTATIANATTATVAATASMLTKPPKSKKRRSTASSSTTTTVGSTRTGIDLLSSSLTHVVSSHNKLKQQASQQPLSYVNMIPARRRKNVAEMLNRTARDLENANLGQLNARRRAIEKGDNELRKLIDQDATGGIHTTCMWKWLEAAGFFRNVTKAEIRELHEEVRAQTADTSSTDQQQQHNRSLTALGGVVGTSRGSIVKASMFDKLQSLLVEEDEGESSTCDTDDDELLLSMEVNEQCRVDATVDLSQLTLDERICVHGQSLGLGKQLRPRPMQDTGRALKTAEDDSRIGNGEVTISNRYGRDSPSLQNGHKANAASGVAEGTLDGTISSMIGELANVDNMNVRRVAFLDTVSQATQLSDSDQKRKNDQESALIAKFQHIMRKSKELKAKSNATIKKDDSLALPW